MWLVIAVSLLVAISRVTSAIGFQNLSLPDSSSLNSSIATSNGISIQAWAKQAREGEYRQHPVHQKAIDILESLFQEKIEPDAAAATITSLYDPWLKQGFDVSPVFQLWGMICEAIQMLCKNIFIDGFLVELLNSISKRPDVTDQRGKAISPGGGFTGVYWRDLPALAIMLREYAFDIEPGEPETPDEGDWTPEQRAVLMSVTTFGALYLDNGQVDLGMSSQAEISFMTGLEQPYKTIDEQRRAKTLVPPAALWMHYGGKKIYQLCQHGTTRKGRGFSLDRWKLWKTKFAEIGRNRALSGVQQWTLSALDSMATAESSQRSQAR